MDARYAQSARSELSAEQSAELVLSLERGTVRLTQLIDNLLESTRIESGQLGIRHQSVALAEVLEDTQALIGSLLVDLLLRSQRQLEIENLLLRHQLNIALRRASQRQLRGSDRALLVWMTWLWPRLLGLSRVVQPDTILRWHRAGFRTYWR